MSRARNIPVDLHRVAQLADTTATVAENAAVAAEKAQAAADRAQEVSIQVTEGARSHRKGLILLLVLGIVGVVALVVWKKSQGAPPEEEIADLRLAAEEHVGSMP